MKDANFAPVYCALYPKLAEVVRGHGYALAIHGSLARDFDLICIPWVENPSEPKEVVDTITSKFAIRVLGVNEPTKKLHGREAWLITIEFGECAIDLSFMPRTAGRDLLDRVEKMSKVCDAAIPAYQAMINMIQHHVQEDCECDNCRKIKAFGIAIAAYKEAR